MSEPSMMRRLHHAATFFTGLPIRSFAGGIITIVAYSRNWPALTRNLEVLNVLGLGSTGLIVGSIPYLMFGVPICLALEDLMRNWKTRTVILVVGGTGIGVAIMTFLIPSLGGLAGWAGAVGGSTGLALGMLRRHGHVSDDL